MALGCVSVYSVTFSDQGVDDLSNIWSTAAGKQIVWVGISLGVVGVIQSINGRFWQQFAYPIYGVSILLLILVLFFGSEIKGATSWFRIGSTGFQPSEVAKFATCIAIAAFLDNYRTDLSRTKSLLLTMGFIIAPMALILLQPDAGSALIFLSFAFVFYRAGMSPNYIFVIGALALLFILSIYINTTSNLIIGLIGIGSLILVSQFKHKRTIYFVLLGAMLLIVSFGFVEDTFGAKGEVVKEVSIGAKNQKIILAHALIFLTVALGHYFTKKRMLALALTVGIAASSGIVAGTNYVFTTVMESHQQDRINMWIRPNRCDPSGPIYNLNQSKMAIGSGGLLGKGLLQGTLTKLDYVPEQSTDFIFCVIGEEQGFAGSLTLTILFSLLLWRIIILAERQKSDFSRFYAYGVAGIIFVHFFINIGMTMGVMPIIGIPLPFISKGGSSLLGFSIMIGVLLNLDSRRYYLF
jgi:rod shape determining protein RodA